MNLLRPFHLIPALVLLAACEAGPDGASSMAGPAVLAPANGMTCFGQAPTHVLVPGGKGTNGTMFKGTNGNDVILGTEGADRINGAGGDDLICGLGGDDDLRGGDGADRIDGGAGMDQIYGQAGADMLYGGPDRDLIWGGDGDDTIWGDAGDDFLRGEGGADTMYGGLGNDRMDGSGWRGTDLGDFMYGEEGDDVMEGAEGDDVMEGGPGNDEIFGESGDDTIDGGPDTDLCGGGGQVGDSISNCEPFGVPGIAATKDSFLRSGRANKNEGINPVLNLRADGNHRAVLDFGAFSTAGLTSATLVMTIAHNADNWGATGRTIDAHPLLVDFTEGNGKNLDLPGAQQTDGTGAAVTWNCATDTDVSNGVANCASQWAGGTYGAATAASFLITNGLSGEVTFDVTTDALAGSTRWLLRKTLENQAGEVGFHSREGATALMSPALAPRLILVYGAP